MKIPTPTGQKCAYCGKPVYYDEAYIAAKPKKDSWKYAHSKCAVGKDGPKA